MRPALFALALILALCSHAAAFARAPLAATLTALPDPEDAQAAEQAARAKLAKGVAGSPEAAVQMVALGRAIHLQERFPEAEAQLRLALAAIEALPQPHAALARTARFDLAEALRLQDKFAEAEPFSRAAWMGVADAGPVERADIAIQLASLLNELQRWDEAAPLAEEALALRTAKLGPDHFRTINAMARLADARIGQGRLGDAEPLLRRVLAARRKGKDQAEILNAEVELGRYFRRREDYGSALPHYRESLNLAQTAFPDDPELIGWRSLELGEVLWLAHQDEDAEKNLRAGLALLAKPNPASTNELYDYHFALASILAGSKRAHEAEVIYRQLLAALEASRDPADREWIATTSGELAHTLMLQTGEGTFAENPHFAEARGLLERQIALIEELDGKQSEKLELPLNRLGLVLFWMGDPRAVEVHARSFSVVPKEPSLRRVKALFASGDLLPLPEQIARLNEARTMLAGLPGDNHDLLFSIDDKLIGIYRDAGDLDRAEQLRRDLLANRLSKGDRVGAAHDQAVLALQLVDRRKFAEAAAMATGVLRILKELGRGDSIDVGYATGVLGAVARQRGDLAEAERLARAELALYEATIPGGFARIIGATLTGLGDILIEQKRPAEAMPYLARAAAIQARWYGPRSADTAFAGLRLARAKADSGDVEGAKELYAASYRDIAADTAKLPGNPALITPTRDYAAFALDDLKDAALARGLLRETFPVIVERAARASVDASAARELREHRASLTLNVRADWQLAQTQTARP